MQELIDQLTSKFGVTGEQATGIIDTVKNYFSTDAAATAASQNGQSAAEGMFEKATHFVEENIPDGLKGKAEEMLGGVEEKLKGFFK
jgi:hypothetical protein